MNVTSRVEREALDGVENAEPPERAEDVRCAGRRLLRADSEGERPDIRSSLTGRSLIPFFWARIVPLTELGWEGRPRAASTSSRYCTSSCALLASGREMEVPARD